MRERVAARRAGHGAHEGVARGLVERVEKFFALWPARGFDSSEIERRAHHRGDCQRAIRCVGERERRRPTTSRCLRDADVGEREVARPAAVALNDRA